MPRPRDEARSRAVPPARSGLVYVADQGAGIRRVPRGEGFAYRTTDGRPVRAAAELRRIAALAIPPAYTDVWICPLSNGHLQATGRDARGRKQYRYHPEWMRQRGERKYEQLRSFGAALPRIRARVARDLEADTGLTRERVLAAIVRLLDATCVRIGNRAYARQNGSFGLTTLENRHARANGSTLRLAFEGKSGVRQCVDVDDARVARLVRRCRELPGQTLFQYVDEDGALHRVDSGEVNDYLRAAAGGQDFTAKDFRTWHASTLALDRAIALRLERESAQEAGPARVSPRELLEPVARQLGNTVAVCRKAYVHPAIVDWHMDDAGDAAAQARRLHGLRAARGLTAAERRLLAFIEGLARSAR